MKASLASSCEIGRSIGTSTKPSRSHVQREHRDDPSLDQGGHLPGAWRGLGVTSPYHIPRKEAEALVARKLEERGGEDFKPAAEERRETK